MAGRGQSEWLANPLEYNYASYVADCLAFMNMFHLRNVDWIGTSMGGIIGMMLAANTQDRIRKLVLNDVGSMLNQQALQRIYGYVQTIPQAFANRADAENYLRRNFAPWGIKTDEHWRFFIDNSLMQNPQGQWQLLCDPAIAEPLRLASDDFTKINAVDLGEIWAKIQIPTLILRGENSDILTAATVSQMQATNPRVQSETIAGCGHAPALAEFAQLALIGNCLAGSSASLLAAGM
jgi:pimeloyl-ACP methyl ester carboxylesterase